MRVDWHGRSNLKSQAAQCLLSSCRCQQLLTSLVGAHEGRITAERFQTHFVDQQQLLEDAVTLHMQRLQLDYNNSGNRGVWLAPAHLTLYLSPQLLRVKSSACVRVSSHQPYVLLGPERLVPLKLSTWVSCLLRVH